MIFDHLFFFSLWGIGMTAWCCGLLSPFVFVRRQSLLADAMSHSAFLGVPIGYYLALTFFSLHINMHYFIVIITSFLFAGLAVFLQFFILEKTRLKSEAALSLLLAGFFSFGMLAFNFLERDFGESSGKLMTFLYGNGASLAKGDLWALVFFAVFISFSVFLYQKFFCLIAFEPRFALDLRFSVRKWTLFLDFLILLMICAGLQIMGTLLMAVLLVAPAAAAKFWVKRFSSLMKMSVFFSLMSGFGGVALSSAYEKMPLGPCVAFIAVIFVLFSLVWHKIHWYKFCCVNKIFLRQDRQLTQGDSEQLSQDAYEESFRR